MRCAEQVIECDACRFAGLVGLRHQEWVPYQMATSESHSVAFSFCSVCGITHCEAAGRFCRQAEWLYAVGGKVELLQWLPADLTPAELSREGLDDLLRMGFAAGCCCGACGTAGSLLCSVPEPGCLHSIRCPNCWTATLRQSDSRAVHPRW